MDIPDWIRELLKPGLSLEETHISWVLLGEKEVWKIKKPVSLGFLDFSTVEKRRAACEAESALNRRLAPGIYLGLVPITLGAGGKFRFGGEGAPIDWAVHMIRLPEADRIDRRLESGRLTRTHLRRLAERLAGFHAACRCDAWTAGFGTADAVARNVRENLGEAMEFLPRFLDPRQVLELEQRQIGFLRDHPGWFDERIRSGRVRDGHGDLRLGQIYIDGRGAVSILDCIEFSDRFRHGDVCADVAFLSMDLACRGRRDLAENFLAAYARASGDFDLYRLADFYESYRACVRGKVACLMGDDDQARRHFLSAISPRPPSTPRLTVLGGGPGSGKSTLAEMLGGEWAVPVISSDWIRKQRLGIAPSEAVSEKAWVGLYSPENTDQVYAEMLRMAGVVLASGRAVILDATFRARAHRSAARRAASAAGAAFAFVECRADREVCRARLRDREGEKAVSDAREALLDGFLEKWEPADEIPAGERVVADTNAPVEKTLDGLLRWFRRF